MAFECRTTRALLGNNSLGLNRVAVKELELSYHIGYT